MEGKKDCKIAIEYLFHHIIFAKYALIYANFIDIVKLIVIFGVAFGN